MRIRLEVLPAPDCAVTQSPDYGVVTGASDPAGRGERLDAFSRTIPLTVPNAQLSALMVMLSSAVAGTLTATGLKPIPQQLPGNLT
jgi:hypothetical protein